MRIPTTVAIAAVALTAAVVPPAAGAKSRDVDLWQVYD